MYLTLAPSERLRSGRAFHSPFAKVLGDVETNLDLPPIGLPDHHEIVHSPVRRFEQHLVYQLPVPVLHAKVLLKVLVLGLHCLVVIRNARDSNRILGCA